MASAYSVEMFDYASIEKNNRELFLRMETVEYNLQIYKKHFDDFKKENYFELYLFEKNKNNLPPNYIVINQINAVFNDPSSSEFVSIIKGLENELAIVKVEIKKLFFGLDNMFSFNFVNLKNYLSFFERYFDNSAKFDDLMYQLFDKEFNAREMYDDIKESNNASIVYLIYNRSPVDWKDFFRAIYFEFEYCQKMNKMIADNDSIELQIFLEENAFDRQKRFSIVKKQRKNIINLSTKMNSNSSEQLYDYVLKSKEDFMISRVENEKRIINDSVHSREFSPFSVPFPRKRMF